MIETKAVIIKYVRCVRHFVALSLRTLKSTPLLIKNFLCSSNQKMLHEKVVKESEKMSHTKFGTILVPFGTTSPNATKLGIQAFQTILNNN